MTATPESIALATDAAAAAADKIASSILALDVSDQIGITDVFLIVSASNERQVGAIVDAVEDAMRAGGAQRLRREGEREGRWVLIDYGDVVIHVQHDEERRFYELERLWRDCPEIDLGVAGTDQEPRDRRPDPEAQSDPEAPSEPTA
ncbi:MAG: ribosome silencing factor [Micrococcales bacterium]|nr:ribosome silencing factor [Micrococcales bacterium]